MCAKFNPQIQRNVKSGQGFRKTGYQKPAICKFCTTKTEPDYKNVNQLRNFITDKGKILSRKITKVCTKHQRRVAVAVKRARMIALLPFVAKYKE